MKNYIVISFFLLFFNTLYSQTVTIGCPPPQVSDCFAGVEPGSQNYQANPFGFAPDAKLTFSWSAVGGVASGATANGSVIWSNTPNNPLKSVTVSVKDTASLSISFNKIAVGTLTVVVKQIGSITTVDASGGGVSQNAVGNNSTLTIPCGPTTFSITVNPPPATYPISQVTYTWVFPWGTQVTNSTTVTTTSNAGASTPIKVTATKIDGTTATPVFTLNVNRPKVEIPTITGIPSNSMCAGSYALLEGNAANAYIYTWTTTGPVSIPFAISNSALIVPAGTGTGTVTLTADNGCMSPKSVTRPIYAGAPVIAATVNNDPLQVPNYIMNPPVPFFGRCGLSTPYF